MPDRNRNPAEKRKGQHTGETARNDARRVARDAHRAAQPPAVTRPKPKRQHVAGKRAGRGRKSSARSAHRG